MLEPANRTLLMEALRPPDGYELDFAVATTYTLDLLSLLIAPLGFTFFEIEGTGADAISSIDPLMLLRTLRKYADRMAIFCQAGRISVPNMQQPLYANLEQSIVQVGSRGNRGIFHPKVWVLRFIKDGAPVSYRLICLSRNLTFDRSWDTCVLLDGELVQRQVGYSVNRPLADFVAALPRLATNQDVPERIQAMISTASNELRRVNFQAPDPFTNFTFYPLGIEGHTASPLDFEARRRLVVSPFLTAATIRELGEDGDDNVLVSRLDALQTLSREDLKGFPHIFAMNPDTETEIGTEDDASDELGEACRGLHAKLFVSDTGWLSSIWTGSANATNAAFKDNVEFLIELEGSRSACGVASIIDHVGDATFRDLLIPFEPLDLPVECDSAEVVLEERLEEARRMLSGVKWLARVVAEAGDNFRLSLEIAADKQAILGDGINGSVWPITLTPQNSLELKGNVEKLDFGSVTFEALTAFFAFELESREAELVKRVRFVLRTQLIGAPADRRERLLRYHLRNPEQVVRFLLLLLALDSDPTGSEAATLGLDPYATSSTPLNSNPVQSLLEPLLRALDRNPNALDQVGETLTELNKTEEGAAIIPKRLTILWETLWQARKTLLTRATQ
jgi:hypothetical protein